MNILALQEKLSAKVMKEYSMWFEHIRNEIDRKRDILNKVLDPNLPEWQVRIPLLWKNIQLENALFLNDELNIEVLTNQWFLWEHIMKNANLVLKYDDTDMDLYEMREDIVNHNAVYWLSATIIDWRDNDEKQPISDTINPLNLIIDPKNYKGSKLRFIWVSRRVSYEDLESNPAFDKRQVEKAEWSYNEELDRTERWVAEWNNQRQIQDNEWMIDIYDHFTVFEWKKILCTWDATKTILLRYLEIEPLTEAEKLKPTKVKFPIQLHRRKPKFWSVFWVSIADEVLVYQDIISQLTNLQLLNTRINSLWPDIFVDDKLWIDTTMLAQGKPGWRVLPIENKSWMPTQNGIYAFQTPPPSQYTDIMIQNLEKRAEETTNINQQAFGNSQPGQQTKAEIQTLQQNANQILSWIANNYLRGQKEYWTSHYRSYALNMWKGKKIISLFQKWNALSLELKREDFVADWKVNIIIVSKSQQQIENDKEFNKLTFISNLYLPNITSEYAKNELLRLMWNKSNVRDFDSAKYIRESVDEMEAKANLELLNNNDEVPSPELWQNPDIYLDIYKQAMDTPAKAKAIMQYKEYAKMMEAEKQAMEQAMWWPQWWVWDQATKNIAMNNINSQSQNIPSTNQATI